MKREYVLMALVAILAFLQLRQCSSSKGPETVIEIRDSISYLPGEIVEVPFEVEKIVYIDRPAEPVDVFVDPVTKDTTRTFETSFSDSLIDVKITSKLKGISLFTDFEYKPKFPKYIFRVDTFKIKSTKEVQVKKWALYGGGSLGGSLSSFSLQPSILIGNKKGDLFGYGYDVVLKTHNIKAYTMIRNPFKKF